MTEIWHHEHNYFYFWYRHHVQAVVGAASNCFFAELNFLVINLRSLKKKKITNHHMKKQKYLT